MSKSMATGHYCLAGTLEPFHIADVGNNSAAKGVWITRKAFCDAERSGHGVGHAAPTTSSPIVKDQISMANRY